MPTNTKEKGFESIIVNHLRDKNGYVESDSSLYSKDVALVKPWLEEFLVATQPEEVARAMCFVSPEAKKRFYQRLGEALDKRGVIDVLRKGFQHNGTTFVLYYPLPSEQNEGAKRAYAKNCFGVIRQLHYSKRRPNDAIDFAVFINGLPLATFELKNHYTGQQAQNAIKQYQTDRVPDGEPLLKPKRCAVHFAVDDTDVFLCTELKGPDSWFLPFNRGVNGGAGNPVISGKTMTSYLWEEVFTKPSLSNIIENFAQVIVETDKKTQKKKEKVIWPRYHQLDAVRRLLAQTAAEPVGRKFLIQHSAGSGKSNTITWLAYQLVLLRNADMSPKFDSIIVITDRINLDRQIRDNINAFAQMDNLVGWAEDSETLRELLQGGKKIVVSTIHKFSFILDEIGHSLSRKRFAIIIDEAHSSQNGEMASSLAQAVNGVDDDADDIEARILEILKGRKLAENANYYAFTATPKNKTLEMFGEKRYDGDKPEFVPFHEYTMKQAIEEGFILNVLRNYTPYKSYYEVVKKVEDDPEFNKDKAPKRIRAYVEERPETIAAKSRIIVDHFCTKVFKRIGGKARAMVVTSSIERAIAFYHAISKLLKERGDKFKAIVAFTDKEIGGKLVTEASLNGFPSSQIEAKIEQEPYRILVVADKFQTGYDQPLLHTMYVDKVLTDLKAVQTLSRLNRAHPKKFDTFVLDFANDPEDIRRAFQRYYKTTILAGESDVNKLHNLTETIERQPFYTTKDLDASVDYCLSGGDEARQKLDEILDRCVARFKAELKEEAQIDAKSAMKNFCRIYPFFAAIMPYESPEWERHYLFYSHLVKKLPILKKEDFTAGLLESIDFDKYRIQREEERDITLESIDTKVDPVPVGAGGGIPEVELDSLSNIVDDFNQAFGGIDWQDEDEVRRQIRDLPRRMQQDADFVNVLRSGDWQTAQIQFNSAIQKVVVAMGEEKLEFTKQYLTNAQFRNFINERVFQSCQTACASREEG